MRSKARSLRERMSIDPDAPSPVTERRARAAEPAEPPSPRAPRERAADAGAEAALPASEASASPVVEEPEVEPSVRSVPTTPPPAEPRSAPAEPAAPAKRSPSRSRSTRAASRRTRRSGKEGLDWETALDDPAISAGGNGYRSFYVSDEVFARFRAAVYWTARRPDVDDVPDNMSVGIEDYMDSVASDLERRFNDKAVFPPTPDQVRAHRKRQNRT